MFLLSQSGCGYKGAPYYEEEKVVDEDANAKFILKNKKSSEE